MPASAPSASATGSRFPGSRCANTSRPDPARNASRPKPKSAIQPNWRSVRASGRRFSEAVPAGFPRRRPRCSCTIRRRLPLVGSRVGGIARSGRPPRARRVPSTRRVAPASARLGGAAAPRARRWRAGKGVLSGKVFEYIAAGRPILAVVPPDGAAAELVAKRARVLSSHLMTSRGSRARWSRCTPVS